MNYDLKRCVCNITLTQLGTVEKGKIQVGKETNGVPSAYHVLIVDDDETVNQSLSAVLELGGYKTAIAATVGHALYLLNANYFDVILLDIKLANENGLNFLQNLQKMTPDTIKIIITGFPSMRNAIDALNLGANGYIMKPIAPQELLKTIKSKIEARARFAGTTKKRLAELADKQVTSAKSSNFHEFLQEMTKEFAPFGLTTNQAKVYATLVSVGLAPASEIAKAARIRREDVYRVTCELEKIGIVMRKIDRPTKFSALPPEDATLILIKSKLSKAAEEIDTLDAKRNIITSSLPKFKLIPVKVVTSIDKIPATENLYARVMRMTMRAKKNIDGILPYKSVLRMCWAHETQKSDLIKHRKEAKKNRQHPTVRIITDNRNHINHSRIIQQLEQINYNLSLRYVKHVSFGAFMVDGAEALWGRFDLHDHESHNLWTNDRVQITILKTAFENLWQNAQPISSNSA
jgi:DNA-binding response OmpR family regulator